jgi:hypothetical protein
VNYSDLVSELLSAAKPFSDLLEYPDEYETGIAVEVEIYPEDILRLCSAIRKLEQKA